MDINVFLEQFGAVVISTATLAMLTLELIKWIVVRVKKEPDWKIPVVWIAIALPVLNFAYQPVMAFLGVGEWALPADWVEWGRTLVVVAISAVGSSVAYTFGMDKLNKAGRETVAARWNGD